MVITTKHYSVVNLQWNLYFVVVIIYARALFPGKYTRSYVVGDVYFTIVHKFSVVWMLFLKPSHGRFFAGMLVLSKTKIPTCLVFSHT